MDEPAKAGECYTTANPHIRGLTWTGLKTRSKKGRPACLSKGHAGPIADFYARWLLAAEKAERLWTRVLANRKFERQVDSLCVLYIPSFEIGACVLMMQLEKQLSTIIVELGSYEELEFCMMVSLGFFQLTGYRYQMTIPHRLTESEVKKAALAVARTEDDDWLHPEKLITTMSLSEAKAWQVRLRAMDEAHRIADRKLLLEGLT